MDSLGFWEMAAVAFVALVVFGPERLPEMAREAAKWVRKFRTSASRSLDDLRQAADIQDLEDELRSLRSELRGARDSVTKPLSSVGDDVNDALRGSGRRSPRSSDLAPPIDMEAT